MFLGSGGLPVALPHPFYDPIYMKLNVWAGCIRGVSFLNIYLGPLLNKSIIFDRFYKAFHSVPLLGRKSLFSTGFIRGFHFWGSVRLPLWMALIIFNMFYKVFKESCIHWDLLPAQKALFSTRFIWYFELMFSRKCGDQKRCGTFIWDGPYFHLYFAFTLP